MSFKKVCKRTDLDKPKKKRKKKIFMKILLIMNL